MSSHKLTLHGGVSRVYDERLHSLSPSRPPVADPIRMSATEPSWWRYFLLAWCAMENLFFTGMLSAWTAFVYLSKREGVYSHLCINATSTRINAQSNSQNATADISGDTPVINGCAAQDNAFYFAITIAICSGPVLICLFGHLNHTHGLRVTRLATLVVCFSGALCLAFTSQENPSFIWGGTVLSNVGFHALFITNCQVSYKFPDRGATAVGVVTTTRLASGGVMLLLIKTVHEHGVPLRQSLLVFAGLHVLILISTLCLFPRDLFRPVDTAESTTSENSARKKLLSEQEDEDAEITEDMAAPEMKDKDSLWATVRSLSFILMAFWVTMHSFTYLFICTVLNAWLNHVARHNQTQVSKMTSVYLAMEISTSPLAFFGGAILDLIAHCLPDRMCPESKQYTSSAITLAFNCLVGAAMCACAITERVSAAYLVMLLMIIHRAFLFTLTSACLRRMYSTELFGVLFTVCELAGTPLLFTQMPLFSWCRANPQNWPLAFLLILAFLTATLILPIYLLRKARQVHLQYSPPGGKEHSMKYRS